MSSNGGVLLLEGTERRLDLVSRLATCFDDRRHLAQVEQQLPEMLRQRIFGLALGHEDLRDHAVLRHDRLVCAVSGKRKVEQQALAGKSTLTRPELSTEQPHGYKKIHYHAGAIDAFLVQMFVEAHASAPERHLLCGRLRTADPGAAAGSREEEMERIVEQIRQRWPEVQIIVRGDSGFRREELMKQCEDNGVFQVVGLVHNPLLRRILAPQMAKAARAHAATTILRIGSARRWTRFGSLSAGPRRHQLTWGGGNRRAPH